MMEFSKIIHMIIKENLQVLLKVKTNNVKIINNTNILKTICINILKNLKKITKFKKSNLILLVIKMIKNKNNYFKCKSTKRLNFELIDFNFLCNF